MDQRSKRCAFPVRLQGQRLERQVGFEPTISTLARLRDTGLRYCRIGSRGGNRTRDVLLNRQTPTANIGPLNRNGCREGNRTLAVWLMRPNCEPSLPASNLVERKGFEPLLLVCRTNVLPLSLTPQNGPGGRIRTDDLLLPKQAD